MNIQSETKTTREKLMLNHPRIQNSMLSRSEAYIYEKLSNSIISIESESKGVQSHNKFKLKIHKNFSAKKEPYPYEIFV